MIGLNCSLATKHAYHCTFFILEILTMFQMVQEKDVAYFPWNQDYWNQSIRLESHYTKSCLWWTKQMFLTD